MSQIIARLPDEMVKEIDHVAQVLHRSWADVVHKAIEIYPEDLDDLNTAIDRLRDPADRSMDWEQAGVNYSLRIKTSAFKELQRIDKLNRLRIIEAIEALPHNPLVGKSLKGDLSGLRRIRVAIIESFTK